MDSIDNYQAARRRLCQGRDVAVAIITGDRTARIAAWQGSLQWDAPGPSSTTPGDDTPVFELATFRGRTDGPACAK